MCEARCVLIALLNLEVFLGTCIVTTIAAVQIKWRCLRVDCFTLVYKRMSKFRGSVLEGLSMRFAVVAQHVLCSEERVFFPKILPYISLAKDSYPSRLESLRG